MSVGDLTEQALGSNALYAQYVAQQQLGAPTGTVDQIPNELKAVASQIAILTDPARIEAVKATIAGQMNAQSGGPTFEDLGERIADVQIETVAQGASTLTVTLIDPRLFLLRYASPPGSGNTFIQADSTGFLWPPIDINFPTGTDCVWRLCQVNASKFTGDANLILTFEDRSVSWLREINSNMGGVSQGSPDATLAGFLKQLVDGANQYLRGHPASSGTDWQPIRLVELVSPKDPNYTSPALPPSSANPKAAVSRQNPNKNKQGLTAAQQKYKDAVAAAQRDLGRRLRLEALEGLPLDRGETLPQAESSAGGLRP